MLWFISPDKTKKKKKSLSHLIFIPQQFSDSALLIYFQVKLILPPPLSKHTHTPLSLDGLYDILIILNNGEKMFYINMKKGKFETRDLKNIKQI